MPKFLASRLLKLFSFKVMVGTCFIFSFSPVF
jgi:hypothetical protein